MPDSEKDLYNSLACLEPSTWPMGEISPEYGESDIRFLCNKFSLTFSDVKFSYRSYKESGGKAIHRDLLLLLNRINTLPISTAECERGFSRMNIVCTSLRSRLTVKHLSSLMFVSLTGPPLRLWKPLPFVKSWFASNKRSALYTNCPKKSYENDFKKEQLCLWDNM